MKNTRRETMKSQAVLLAILLSSTGKNLQAQTTEDIVPTSFNLDPDLMNNTLVHIKLENTSVCGFLATMADKNYVLTNLQLILGHEHFTLTTLSGTTLLPISLELSTTRDIVRIHVETEKGLNLGSGVTNETPLVLADFSNLDGSVSELSGSVLNASEERFDLSTLFEIKHSGSPVLDANSNVCGITSHIDYYKVKKGHGKIQRATLFIALRMPPGLHPTGRSMIKSTENHCIKSMRSVSYFTA